MVAQIDGADFFTIHCKTQDSNPDNISSDAKFTDDPLKWQFLHIRAYQPLLEAIPAHLRPRAVHATEVNPQRHNDMVTLGWQHDQGPKWVSKVIEHFHDWNVAHAGGLEVNSVIFYRFSGDQWALNPNHQNILDAIRDEIKKG